MTVNNAIKVIGIITEDIEGNQHFMYFSAPSEIEDPISEEPMPEDPPIDPPVSTGRFIVDPNFNPDGLSDNAKLWRERFWYSWDSRTYGEYIYGIAVQGNTYTLRAVHNAIMALAQLLYATGDPRAWQEIDKIMEMVRSKVAYYGDTFLCIPSQAPGQESPGTRYSLNDHLFFGLAAITAFLYAENGNSEKSQYWIDYCLNEHWEKWQDNLLDTIDRSPWARELDPKFAVMCNSAQMHPMSAVMMGWLLLGHLTDREDLTNEGKRIALQINEQVKDGSGWGNYLLGYGKEVDECHHIGYGGFASSDWLFVHLADLLPFSIEPVVTTWRRVYGVTDIVNKHAARDVCGNVATVTKFVDLQQNAIIAYGKRDTTGTIAEVASQIWDNSMYPQIPAGLVLIYS